MKGIKEFNHGIKLMKWSKSGNGSPACVFAKATTVRGCLILRSKGYYPHETIFGKVMRKDFNLTTRQIDND